jgi:RNA polymerase sigma-70 factor (ECF subfamily)
MGTAKGNEMNGNDWLADRFEENRVRLRVVAHRMLGSSSDADDAVQEAWLRLSRTDAQTVDNLPGWLTTVVARICLDMLRSRRARPEEPIQTPDAEQVSDLAADPEREAMLADSVGLAMLVVLETLTPAERLAFVLHDMFAVPFDEIAPIVDRSPDAAKMLASRARRRVQSASLPDPDRARNRQIVDAFLAASREGDFAALLATLDPNAVLRSDAVAAGFGAEALATGADAVAGQFSGRAQVAKSALLDGRAGAVWAPGGTPRVAFRFTIEDTPAGTRITGIELLADPETLARLDVEVL